MSKRISKPSSRSFCTGDKRGSLLCVRTKTRRIRITPFISCDGDGPRFSPCSIDPLLREAVTPLGAETSRENHEWRMSRICLSTVRRDSLPPQQNFVYNYTPKFPTRIKEEGWSEQSLSQEMTLSVSIKLFFLSCCRFSVNSYYDWFSTSTKSLSRFLTSKKETLLP